MSVLDNPVWHALTTRHRHLAEGSGPVRRYRDGVSNFWAFERPDPEAWAAVSDFGDDRAMAVIIGPSDDPLPPDWPVAWHGTGFQMVFDRPVLDPPAVALAQDVRRLGLDDVDAMLALVELTRPGPFLPGTIEMGEYHGVVRDGRLVAMAGQRFDLGRQDERRPELNGAGGFHEISAVATHPEVRGQGLAAALSTLVARRIIDDGDVPFLHVVGTNTGAIRVYERLGFRVRRPFTFTAYERPGRVAGSRP